MLGDREWGDVGRGPAPSRHRGSAVRRVLRRDRAARFELLRPLGMHRAEVGVHGRGDLGAGVVGIRSSGGSREVMACAGGARRGVVGVAVGIVRVSVAGVVQVAVPFTWLGTVLAISFLETPLRFRAPGITVSLGL